MVSFTFTIVQLEICPFLSFVVESAKPAYDPVMSNFTRGEEEDAANADEPEKPKKQHKGLRCIKCFALLCRDDDFDYINGKLWINSKLFKQGAWDGLTTRGSWVSVLYIMNNINISTRFTVRICTW